MSRGGNECVCVGGRGKWQVGEVGGVGEGAIGTDMVVWTGSQEPE